MRHFQRLIAGEINAGGDQRTAPGDFITPSFAVLAVYSFDVTSFHGVQIDPHYHGLIHYKIEFVNGGAGMLR